MVENLLADLGFSDKEVKVYLAALQFGMQPASVLAKHVKMNRVTTYVICKKLIERGVANVVTRNNIQYFTVEKPEALVRYAEHQQKEWVRRRKAVEASLGDFSHYLRDVSALPKVRFYEGLEGVKRVYEDTLAPGGHSAGRGASGRGGMIRAFLTVDTIPEELREFFVHHYMPELLKRKIVSHIVMPESDKARQYSKRDKRYNRKTVFVKPGEFPFETEVAIYGKDRVAFISFREGDLTAVIIENQAIHHTLAAVFELLFGVGRF